MNLPQGVVVAPSGVLSRKRSAEILGRWFVKVVCSSELFTRLSCRGCVRLLAVLLSFAMCAASGRKSATVVFLNNASMSSKSSTEKLQF